MDKATPTPSPATVESVKRLAESLERAHLRACSDTFDEAADLAHGKAWDDFNAELERLAAQAAPTELSTSGDFIVRTNTDYAAWCATYYTPESLDDRGMMSLHGLWAWQEQERRKIAAQPSQAPVVQAVQARDYPPLPPMTFCLGYDSVTVMNAIDADRASSCAAQAAPFAKDSWQHAVDNQLVAFGRTSQEFANPHEALAWLAIVNMELGQSNVGAAQAVRVLTKEALTDLIAQHLSGTYHCLRVWEAWHVGTMSADDFQDVGESDTPAELADAIIAAGKRIPADGEVRG